MPSQTDTQTLPGPPIGRLVVASWRARGPEPADSRVNWLRIGAWTTGLVVSAATWAGIAMAILALV